MKNLNATDPENTENFIDTNDDSSITVSELSNLNTTASDKGTPPQGPTPKLTSTLGES